MQNNLFEEVNTTLPFEIPKENGFSQKYDEKLNGFFVEIPNDGKMFYADKFFDRETDEILEFFLKNNQHDWRKTNWYQIPDEEFCKIKFKNIKWRHDKIKMYGKEIPLPRYTAWYGKAENHYLYSSINNIPNPWNKGLLRIKEKIEKVSLNFTEEPFNSVLLNWYRTGKDSLNWHSDDEKELGKNPVIASVNFGATRDFQIRNNQTQEKITIPLKNGSLLVMAGQMQHFWQHCVPKRKKVTENRINLTFRNIKT